MNDVEATRRDIMFASQRCEEIGLGMSPLSEEDLRELEEQARLLLSAVTKYRAAVQSTEAKP